MSWCDHSHNSTEWKVLRNTGVDHVVLVLSHELMDCNLHSIHSLALKLQQAWDSRGLCPVKTLMDSIGGEEGEKEDEEKEETINNDSNNKSNDDITRGGTLADGNEKKEQRKKLTFADHSSKETTSSTTSTSTIDNESRASFSVVDVPHFLQSLPLSMKDFHKFVRMHAQTTRDQLLRGWLAYGREKYAIDSQVAPTSSELASDKTGILQAQMDRLDAANEQRKLDPRNGGAGMSSSSSSSSGSEMNKKQQKKKNKKNKKKISPMIESINDLRRRYEALEDDGSDSGLLTFANSAEKSFSHLGGGGGGTKGGTKEVEEWVEALPDLDSGITGGNIRHKDEVSQVLQMTETVLRHPQIQERDTTGRDAMIVSKTLKERRRELLLSGTTLMSRQLRAMVDQSVEEFVNFFVGRWSNDTPMQRELESLRMQDIQKHMATTIALDGLWLDVNDDDTADVMLPPLLTKIPNGTTCYPNGMLPFLPKTTAGAELQAREVSKKALVLACIHHSLSPTIGSSPTDQKNKFQDELLLHSTECNTSVLTTSLIVTGGEGDVDGGGGSGGSGGNPRSITLSPSLAEMESVVLDEILEEFRLAIREFPTAHSERDVQIESEKRRIELELEERRNSSVGGEGGERDGDGIRSYVASSSSSSKKKKKKKKKNKKEETLQLYLDTCTYSTEHEAILTNAKRRIKNILKTNVSGPNMLEKRMKKFEWLFHLDEDVRVEKLTKRFEQVAVQSTKELGDIDSAKDPGLLLDAYEKIELRRNAILKEAKRLVEKYRMTTTIAERSIHNQGESVEHYPVYSVDCRGLLDSIRERSKKLSDQVLDGIASSSLRHMQRICSSFEQIGAKLVREPTDAAELRRLQEYSETCVFDIENLERTIKIEPLFKANFLLKMGYQASSDDVSAIVLTLGWPLNILEYRARSTKVQNAEKAKREEVLIARKEYFAHELSRLERDVSGFSSCGHTSSSSITQYCTRLSNLKISLEEATEEARTIVDEEDMLGFSEERKKDSMLYKERLAAMSVTQKTFESLWETVRDQRINLKMWNETPLHTMSGEKVTNDADNIKRTMTKLVKKFDKMGIDYEAPSRVALEMKEEMVAFCRDCNPLLEILCTNGLKERHWDIMNKTTDLDIPFVMNQMTLQLCVEHGLEEHVSKIEETCVNATKEYSLEKALDNMELDWEGLEFGTKAYKDTGTSILMSVEDIQNVLDDQIVRAQAMRGSRYVKPFEARVIIWEKTLNDLQDIMDNWLSMQGTWLYLEPIFSSEDICKQMPQEAKRFRTVDGTFRGAQSRVESEPGVIKIAQTDGLLEQLVKANELLNEIQKGLNDYLETKRVFFPRFFFLGNDEMLEILSETKDPLKVQPHLSKIFEGISLLDFSKTLDILGMISAEGENVPFSYDEIGEKKINPQDSNGQVEQWVKEVEIVMRKTVALQIDKSMDAYAKEAVAEGHRETYVQKWPGMVVLAVTCTFWTTEVEAALRACSEGDSDAVLRYSEQLTKQLFIIVEMVRGKLTKLQRKTISALVTLDVHARDVTEELATNKISKIDDFDWLSQLRYYHMQGGDSAKTGMPGSLVCRMINAERLYAYEYLGNSSRLVITPLTDRCYRTLMTAIHLDYGGAPAGPAGTGKTETTKDLGKAIAIQTVVYNCSDTLDYIAMGKFFKGLAGTGAWACFDEFNRITLEVLSVVAQQILTIAIAKAANLERFDFEGQNISLRRTCCVYVTMNPGYAGRQELPDNLKALFRSVAMMVPDYAQIAQIILYSMGYMEGEQIANKIVTTYRLCSEQLSKQKHYDYGMRAVIAVVLSAGAMKRKNPDAPEMELGLRATVDVNLPKFLSYDVPLFNGIVGDLFPGVKVPEVDRGVMLSEMILATKEMGLQPTKYFIDKVFQIWEMMLIRHGTLCS